MGDCGIGESVEMRTSQTLNMNTGIVSIFGKEFRFIYSIVYLCSFRRIFLH